MRALKFSIIVVGIFLFIACGGSDSSTGTSNGNLVGKITLSDTTEHSNIFVAIYPTKRLNSDIVRIQEEYPFIGTKISQVTDFDHRISNPINHTLTNSNGNFNIENIPSGVYNIAFFKKGFGYKYIYNFNLRNGDNKLSSEANTLTLNKEIELPGIVSDDYIFEQGKHYIANNNVVFTGSLDIHEGSIIRIARNKKISINGQLSINSNINNPFKVTCNFGFGEMKSYSVSDLFSNRFNTVTINASATISNDEFKEGIFEYGNYLLTNKKSGVTFRNLIMRNTANGLLCLNTNNIRLTESIFDNSSNNANLENMGFCMDFTPSGSIERSIFNAYQYGIRVDRESSPAIKNNYIINCTRDGIFLRERNNSTINNNIVKSCNFGITIRGLCTPTITENTVNAITTGIAVLSTGYTGDSIAEIHNNNINAGRYFLYIDGNRPNPNRKDINAQNNYFYTDDRDIISEKVRDKNDLATNDENRLYTGNILCNPFKSEAIAKAKINRD